MNQEPSLLSNYRRHINRLRHIKSQNRTSLQLPVPQDALPYARPDLERLKQRLQDLAVEQQIRDKSAAQIDQFRQPPYASDNNGRYAPGKGEKDDRRQKDEKVVRSRTKNELSVDSSNSSSSESARQKQPRKRSFSTKYKSVTIPRSELRGQISGRSNHNLPAQHKIVQSKQMEGLRLMQVVYNQEEWRDEQRKVLYQKTRILATFDGVLMEISSLGEDLLLVRATEIALRGKQWRKLFKWNKRQINTDVTQIAKFIQANIIVSLDGIQLDGLLQPAPADTRDRRRPQTRKNQVYQFKSPNKAKEAQQTLTIESTAEPNNKWLSSNRKQPPKRRAEMPLASGRMGYDAVGRGKMLWRNKSGDNGFVRGEVGKNQRVEHI